MDDTMKILCMHQFLNYVYSHEKKSVENDKNLEKKDTFQYQLISVNMKQSILFNHIDPFKSSHYFLFIVEGE